MRFRPQDVETFRMTGFDVEPDSGAVTLGYALDDRYRFTERLDFGPRGSGAGDAAGGDGGFERVVRLLHLAAGVSYYKAAAPDVIAVETGPLTEVERRFCQDLYDKGLREFAWHNDLPLERRLQIVDAGGSSWASASPPAGPPPGLGVPVGGGKDSAVVVEALRPQRPVLLSVNGHPAARRVAAAADLELAVVHRTLDPLLFELNEAGARNGHVPITAIVSLIAVAAGYRLGYDTTVMALEGSADEATRSAGGPSVNHQWSKSSEFERSLVGVLAASVGSAVHYRSVLRDVGELDIAACFAGLPRYHRAFVSCNRAFGRGGVDGWCGKCPKCRFVFLALATAMGADRLVPIFGADLLADAGQVEGFRDLFEEGRKPFECVGTRAESLLAFSVLARSPSWSQAPVVQALAPVADAALRRAGGPPAWEPPDPQAVLEQVRRAVAAPVP